MNAYSVTLQDCLLDAELNGNHQRPLKPYEECKEVVDHDKSKIEVKSEDGKYRFFGISHVFYLETTNGPQLMAGDQTELKSIKKAWIDINTRRIYVLQGGKSWELLTFNLDFIGNVTPLKLFRDKILGSVAEVKSSGKEDLLLTLKDGRKILINADAESRDLSTQKKPVIRAQK